MKEGEKEVLLRIEVLEGEIRRLKEEIGVLVADMGTLIETCEAMRVRIGLLIDMLERYFRLTSA